MSASPLLSVITHTLPDTLFLLLPSVARIISSFNYIDPLIISVDDIWCTIGPITFSNPEVF